MKSARAIALAAFSFGALLLSCHTASTASIASPASDVAVNAAPDAAAIEANVDVDASFSAPLAIAPETDAGTPAAATATSDDYDDGGGGPHDFSASLSRTACLGTCPMYVVHVGPHGTVHFSSRLFVHDHFVDGCASKNIGDQGVAALKSAIAKNRYFSLQTTYTGGPTDAPSTIMSVTMDHKTKVVDHYMGAPVRAADAKRLDAVEDAIDKISGAADFATQGGSLTPCKYTGV